MKDPDEKLSTYFKPFESNSYNEEQKQTGETFRDPNLSIDSMREMKHKQCEWIAAIESTLREMNQVPDHLKAWNEFTPSFSFDLNSFG